jgi:Ca-activated chloride channel homolog
MRKLPCAVFFFGMTMPDRIDCRSGICLGGLWICILLLFAGTTSLRSQSSTAEARYSIKANVDLVVLPVSVLDRGGRKVQGLNKEDFRVYEDRMEQTISFFSAEDAPVTMGLVIDNSGSMRGKREQVVAAAMSFVKTSNSRDEIFVVNFNDRWYLDLKEDFTSDPVELLQALSRIDASAGTALYDALLLSLSHIKKGNLDRKVLLLITDGDDDASRATLEQTVRSVEESRATIYTIGIFSRSDQQEEPKMVRNSKKILTRLARATGGVAYFPDDIAQIEAICGEIAREIRDQYTLGYYPANTSRDGKFRSVRVRVQSPRLKGKLTAHSRAGYTSPR